MIGFDSFGRWHPEPGRAADETQGWIPKDIMPDAPTFDGPLQLARLLSSRDEARRCFAQQWLEYASGRGNRVSSAEPPRNLGIVFDAFKAGGFHLRELIVAVASSDQILEP